MEVSVIGTSQAQIGRARLAYRKLGFYNPAAQGFSRTTRICFDHSQRWRTDGVRFSLNAVHSELLRSEKFSGDVSTSARRSKPVSSFLFFCFQELLFGCWETEEKRKKMIFMWSVICLGSITRGFFFSSRMKILFVFKFANRTSSLQVRFEIYIFFCNFLPEIACFSPLIIPFHLFGGH